MRLSSKQLVIVANPFAAPLAADGSAVALCPVDPTEPMGSDYINARTVAAVRKQPRTMASPFGTRDKVRVAYNLKPVSVPDSSHYRAKIKSGEVFECADLAPVIGAAAGAFVEHILAGGGRSETFAAWRAQGLSPIADAVEAIPFKGIGPLPPASNEEREAPPPLSPPALVSGDTLTEGAVS